MKAIFVLLATLLLGASSPQEKKPAPLEGYYVCVGETANREQYHGLAIVKSVEGKVAEDKVYVVSWLVDGLHYCGVGVLSEDGKTFSVGWAYPSSDGKNIVRGMTVYARSGKDGRDWKGTYRLMPSNETVVVKALPETLEFMRELPKAPKLTDVVPVPE